MENISGIDIKNLLDEFGSPLYVYVQEQIIHNYNELYKNFTKYYKNFKIHYSVKANSNIHILKIFKELNSGVDCSSPGELMLARMAGFNDSDIIYTGNYESIDDFNELQSDDIKINLDDISSFSRLIKVFTPKKISFRINPGIGRGGFEGITTAGADAKFGIPYEKAEIAYKMALEHGIRRFGIHMMTGSNNLEPYYFAEILDKLLKIAGDTFGKLGISPEYVDIGGGLGTPYHDDEEELNLDLTASLVSDIFREKCAKYGFGEPELYVEPGRFLVANAGYLITKVTGVKKSYKTFVGVDAGMNTLLRPALYGAYHRTSVYGKHNLDTNVNLCGQICENSDIFAKGIFLPEVVEGDIITFKDAGAYGYAMASNYNNRLKPAEVLIENKKARLIRRREKKEDLLSLYE